MSILNTAASGKFSTDRTMQQYNADIWRLQPVAAFPVGAAPVDLPQALDGTVNAEQLADYVKGE